MKIDMTECVKTENLATPSDIAGIETTETLNTLLMQKIKLLPLTNKALVSEFIDDLLV